LSALEPAFHCEAVFEVGHVEASVDRPVALVNRSLGKSGQASGPKPTYNETPRDAGFRRGGCARPDLCSG
jgi:hypothetical protein